MTKMKWGPANGRMWKRKEADNARALTVRVLLDEMKVDPHILARLPKFSPILEDKSLGGLDQVLQAMRLSTDPTIGKFLERYDVLTPAQQAGAPWEAVAYLAHIDGRQLLGAIILALRQYSATGVKIAALTSHPEVTKATIDAALRPSGTRDRQMLHTALGFLAPPKGQTINVNIPGLVEVDDGDSEIAAEDIDMNEVFPDVMATQKKMLQD